MPLLISPNKLAKLYLGERRVCVCVTFQIIKWSITIGIVIQVGCEHLKGRDVLTVVGVSSASSTSAWHLLDSTNVWKLNELMNTEHKHMDNLDLFSKCQETVFLAVTFRGWDALFHQNARLLTFVGATLGPHLQTNPLIQGHFFWTISFWSNFLR